MFKRLSLLLVSVTLAVSGFWYFTRPPAAPPRPPLTGPAPDLAGFARALAPQDFSLPRDHGPHFDYQTEWWYYTSGGTTPAT